MAGCSAAIPSPDQPGGSRPLLRSADEPGTRQPSASTEAGEPTSLLTLQDAVALALLKNPELAEYSWQVRANEARVLQAALRPNPEAMVFIEDVLGTGRFRGAREAQVTLQLGQAIELGGKRAARVAGAAESRDLASREYEVKRVEVLARVTGRFIDLLSAQQLLGLARTNLRLGEQTLEATVRRVKTGAGSALDERKARIELARGRIVAEHAAHVVAAARRELAATWGSATPRFERVEGDLFGRRAVPSYDRLTERLAQAPEMLRQLSEKRLREAEIRLADAKRIPTPSLAAGIRRLEGPEEESLVFGLSVPLPTSDRNQGGRAEARALLSKSEEEGRTTEVRLRTVIFGLHQELRHASTALDALEKEILPQADESLSLARSGFTEGRFSYLELVDAERTLRAVQKERIETAASYHELVLEIERLMGEPIDAGSRQEKAVAP
jgi:cobalt-zinc-cadmium efflux system outer membrane protein